MLNLLSTIISTEVPDDGLTLHRDSKRFSMAPTQLGLTITVTPQHNLCRVGWPHLPRGQEACSSVQGTAHFTPLYNVRLWTMTLLPPALSQLGIICMMDSPHACRPMSLLVRGLLICTVNSLISFAAYTACHWAMKLTARLPPFGLCLCWWVALTLAGPCPSKWEACSSTRQTAHFMTLTPCTLCAT